MSRDSQLVIGVVAGLLGILVFIASFGRSPDLKPDQKNNPFPTHAENGYYLEDAVWMAQYREDIEPPSEEIRNNPGVGTYVKLLFRFQAENASRESYETERMWVVITALDHDEYFIGTLENDPNHGHVLKCGDTIHFHPVHVMEVLNERRA